jgi:hypothetical protein
MVDSKSLFVLEYDKVREIVAGPLFDTPDSYVLDATDGIFTNFIIVDNYIYGDGKNGMVTYRIDAL